MNMEELRIKLSEELAGCSGRASLFLEIEGQIIEFNSKDVYQSASLIKLPILFEALRLIEKGILQEERLLTIREEDLVGDTGVLQVLKERRFSILDLLALMVIVSDNSATNIIIETIGMDSINSAIARLGMKDTLLQRKMLDCEAMQSGLDNFTTAADIALCLKEGLESPTQPERSRDIFHSFLCQQQFKEKLPVYMDDNLLLIGNKTGELPGVEHDCGVITYGKKRAYAVILIDGLSEPETGKVTIRQIGKHISSFITGISTGNTPF